MANYQNQNLDNREFIGIPGSDIVWKHMELANGRNGNRYFAIKLTEEFAAELESEGWPVIWYTKDEDQESALPYLKVFIKYGTRFPVDIYMVNANRKTKTLLEESDLDNLHVDSIPLDSIDLIIHAYYWTYNDDHGVKAQVDCMNIYPKQRGFDDDLEIVYKSQD